MIHRRLVLALSTVIAAALAGCAEQGVTTKTNTTSSSPAGGEAAPAAPKRAIPTKTRESVAASGPDEVEG